MQAITKFIAQTTRSAAAAVKRTPVEIAIGFANALVMSWAIAHPSGDAHAAVRFILSSFLALLAVFATSVLHRLGVIGSTVRRGLTVAYLFGALCYGSFIFDPDKVAETYRWGLLAFALGTGILLAPLSARHLRVDGKTAVWRFSVRLISRVVITGAYTSLLLVGLVLGFVATGKLFGVRWHDELMGYLTSFVFLGVGTWVVVAGLPEMARLDKPVDEAVAPLIRRAGSWLFLPLLALYMLILYAYGIKVLVTGETLSNVISPLALGAAMLGLVGIFLAEPLSRVESAPLVSRIIKWFPAAYLPVVALPAWAIWARIDQYGWTEFRYLRLEAVLAVGVCCVIGAVRLVAGRRLSAVTIPAVFAAAAFLASFGPWGVTTVTFCSQKQRLVADLDNAHLLVDGKIRSDASEADWRDRPQAKEVRSRALYLVRHFGADSIADLAPAQTTSSDKDDAGKRVLEVLGLTWASSFD